MWVNQLNFSPKLRGVPEGCLNKTSLIVNSCFLFSRISIPADGREFFVEDVQL